MRKETIIDNISVSIERSIAINIVDTFQEMVKYHNSCQPELVLSKGGRFVEHVLRAIEYIVTGQVVKEIKSVDRTINRLESETNLPEALRLLVPRALYGMIYNLRSKRNAVHVKEIDPTQIDAALTVNAAGWVLAEFIRLYHNSCESVVARIMVELSHPSMPLLEFRNDEVFVNQDIGAKLEVLLLIFYHMDNGINRKRLGQYAKCSAPSVTKSLHALVEDRYVHFGKAIYYITATGERYLDERLAELDLLKAS